MIQLRDFPTYDEILLIEHAARRAQAVEVSRLAGLAARKIKALTLQFGAALWRAFDRAADSGASPTLASVMEELGASLPSELKTRYAAELATAARVAPAIDFGFAAWEFAARVVAGVFQGIAQGLRAGAWCLDVMARRLMPLQHWAGSAGNGYLAPDERR